MTEPRIPREAFVPKFGRVRVLSYNGNDLFWVLTNRDEKRLFHRDELRFRK